MPPKIKDTHEVIFRKDSRAAQIAMLDINDSVTISQRLALDFGVSPGAIHAHADRLRSIMEQQTSRIRKEYKDRKFVVETSTGLTKGGALMIHVTTTRTD